MSKRILPWLLIAFVTVGPVSAATPADPAEGDRSIGAELLQAWTGLLRFLGVDVADGGREGERPQSFSEAEEGGPHTDPSG